MQFRETMVEYQTEQKVHQRNSYVLIFSGPRINDVTFHQRRNEMFKSKRATIQVIEKSAAKTEIIACELVTK